jgi:hypothetical protein
MPYRQHQKGSGALQTLDAAKRLLDDPQLPAVALVDRRPAFVTGRARASLSTGGRSSLRSLDTPLWRLAMVGDQEGLRRLADVIAHEAFHVRHGLAERPAVEEKFRVL